MYEANPQICSYKFSYQFACRFSEKAKLYNQMERFLLWGLMLHIQCTP